MVEFAVMPHAHRSKGCGLKRRMVFSKKLLEKLFVLQDDIIGIQSYTGYREPSIGKSTFAFGRSKLVHYNHYSELGQWLAI